MTRSHPSLLFLAKAEDDHVARALAFCRERFGRVDAFLGKWREPLPEGVKGWEGDWLVSYLSRWVVPARVLKRARRGAINFHPATPDYPGAGCTNFALYENASEYGVMCHHMAEKVDTGDIIAVRRFPVLPSDDVASLLRRAYDSQLALFQEIMALVLAGKELPTSRETWTRRPFTRKELNELARITPEMSKEEIARRIRATWFGPWKPTIELHGFTFELKDKGKE